MTVSLARPPARVLLAVLLGLLGFSTSSSSESGEEPGEVIVVIVSNQSTLTALDRVQLKRIFQRELQDSAIVPLNLAPGSPERSGFDFAISKMTPTEVGRFWIDQKIRRGTTPPKVVPNPTLLLKVVANFPQTIGYVRLKDLGTGVRVLTVDGLLPTDPKYPIRLLRKREEL